MIGRDAAAGWLQFVMILDKLEPQAIEDVFVRHGAWSVTLSDAGNDPILEPVPGETPLWSDTLITGLFSGDADFQQLERDLLTSLRLDELPPHRTERLENRAWEREWLKDFGPMRFGNRLWICPGETTVDQSDAVIVQLDPGLAFGTGTHATTALCLEWLDGLSLTGKTILDYGCGSGVLAIAALKLGCGHAQAMDIDPQAVVATRRNAAEDGVGGRLTVTGSADGIEGQFDIVVANILAGPLAELAPGIAEHLKPGGLLGLSGILSEQADDVSAAYASWVEFDEPEYRPQDGQTWTRLTGRKRHS